MCSEKVPRWNPLRIWRIICKACVRKDIPPPEAEGYEKRFLLEPFTDLEDYLQSLQRS